MVVPLGFLQVLKSHALSATELIFSEFVFFPVLRIGTLSYQERNLNLFYHFLKHYVQFFTNFSNLAPEMSPN